MSHSVGFVQPPGNIPMPLLADMDGQSYVAAVGISRFLTVAPALVGGAYAVGACIGGLLSLTGAARSVGNGNGIVYGVSIIDPARNASPLDVIFFNTNPTASTFTDAAVANLAAADAAKVV